MFMLLLCSGSLLNPGLNRPRGLAVLSDLTYETYKHSVNEVIGSKDMNKFSISSCPSALLAINTQVNSSEGRGQTETIT